MCKQQLCGERKFMGALCVTLWICLLESCIEVFVSHASCQRPLLNFILFLFWNFWFPIMLLLSFDLIFSWSTCSAFKFLTHQDPRHVFFFNGGPRKVKGWEIYLFMLLWPYPCSWNHGCRLEEYFVFLSQ